MTENRPTKPSTGRVGKAYILTLIFIGVAIVGTKMWSPEIQSAGFTAAAVTAIIGTVWLISDRKNRRTK